MPVSSVFILTAKHNMWLQTSVVFNPTYALWPMTVRLLMWWVVMMHFGGGISVLLTCVGMCRCDSRGYGPPDNTKLSGPIASLVLYVKRVNLGHRIRRWKDISPVETTETMRGLSQMAPYTDGWQKSLTEEIRLSGLPARDLLLRHVVPPSMISHQFHHCGGASCKFSLIWPYYCNFTVNIYNFICHVSHTIPGSQRD